MTDAAKDTMFGIVERWGFPTLVAMVCGYVLRQDVLLPLIQSHQESLKAICETQHYIAESMKEQTKLLYDMQQRTER